MTCCSVLIVIIIFNLEKQLIGCFLRFAFVDDFNPQGILEEHGCLATITECDISEG